MKGRRLRQLAIAIAAFFLAGCANGALPEIREHPYTFLGVAVEVQTGEDYRVGPRPAAYSPGVAGGGEFSVGPAEIVLHDGTELTVPADTPGGNACEELYDPASMDIREGEFVDRWEQLDGVPKSKDCVLIGSADQSGRVEWFQVLNQQYPGSELADVGSVVDVGEDGTVLATAGYRFPLSENVANRCLSGRDRDVVDLVEERPGLHEALLDPRTGQVVEVNCISDN